MSVMMCEACEKDIDSDFIEMFEIDHLMVCKDCIEKDELTTKEEDLMLTRKNK